MPRFIGIRHRVKRTAEGEERPTMVAIKEGDAITIFELEDEMAELDFVLGRFPTSYRAIEENEDLKSFLPHQIKVRKKKGLEDGVISVPATFDGLKCGDTVAMVLGGSGDRFAYALSRRAEEISANVIRITPFLLKDHRDDIPKDDDHITLANLAVTNPDLFYAVGPRDRDFIAMREAYCARRDAQKDRIRCEQRLRQRFIGQIFLSPEGKYPEGLIEDEFDKVKANDAILQNLVREEAQREAELKKAMWCLDVWKILESVEGCGEIIAAGIITSVGDIRRFATDAKFKAYCGVHVLPDGRFPRKRMGAVANWTDARQALYQLAQQFVYRPDSAWGLKYRQYKENFRVRHPEVVVEANGKKRYTNGHIHNMARWRTLSRFVEWLHREWMRLEERRLAEQQST